MNEGDEVRGGVRVSPSVDKRTRSLNFQAV